MAFKAAFKFSQSDQSMCIIGLGCLLHAVSNDDSYIMCAYLTVSLFLLVVNYFTEIAI